MTLRPLFLTCLLVACAGPEEPRFLIEPAAPDRKERIAVATIEVRDVSLPAYAAEPVIYAEDISGALMPLGASLWADDPVRGVTTALVADLSDRTTATVAAEPWPLSEPAQARLDVRVAQAFARADGVFTLSGQFAVASPDDVVREFVRRFEIKVPVVGEGSGAVARAQSSAIGELAALVGTALR
ncbi:MAG: PqiC family protein [Pseudomonadota bacterium]